MSAFRTTSLNLTTWNPSMLSTTTQQEQGRFMKAGSAYEDTTGMNYIDSPFYSTEKWCSVPRRDLQHQPSSCLIITHQYITVKCITKDVEREQMNNIRSLTKLSIHRQVKHWIYFNQYVWIFMTICFKNKYSFSFMQFWNYIQFRQIVAQTWINWAMSQEDVFISKTLYENVRYIR